MRRSPFDSSAAAAAPKQNETWLDLLELARVAVTSEDPDHPIESAFTFGKTAGWRAGGRGEQTIRLIFDPPQPVRRVWLCFSETEIRRTQEFSLRWWPEPAGISREIVRQQWNFSPDEASTEIEDYRVDLNGVAILELTIDPDVSKQEAVATLAEWRLA